MLHNAKVILNSCTMHVTFHAQCMFVHNACPFPCAMHVHYHAQCMSILIIMF